MEGKILALVAPSAGAPVPDHAPGAGSRQPARRGDHDDDEWMLLARSGRPGAFDALVRRHQGRALAVAHRYLGQGDLAKDVAQNTFLEIYRRLDTYRADGKFRAYFHRVLLNQCRMAARSRRTRTRFHERLADASPEELSRERRCRCDRRCRRRSGSRPCRSGSRPRRPGSRPRRSGARPRRSCTAPLAGAPCPCLAGFEECDEPTQTCRAIHDAGPVDGSSGEADAFPTTDAAGNPFDDGGLDPADSGGGSTDAGPDAGGPMPDAA